MFRVQGPQTINPKPILGSKGQGTLQPCFCVGELSTHMGATNRLKGRLLTQEQVQESDREAPCSSLAFLRLLQNCFHPSAQLQAVRLNQAPVGSRRQAAAWLYTRRWATLWVQSGNPMGLVFTGLGFGYSNWGLKVAVGSVHTVL